MANIDLQSLISQLSVSSGGQPGAKAAGQANTAGQLFGSILGQQQSLQTADTLTGKSLPDGKGLPVMDDATGVTPEMVKLAQALAQLIEQPQAAGSLPVQELQTQIHQLLQAEDGMARETSLDDLSALTNLLLATDAAPTLPSTTAAISAMQAMPNSADINVELHDTQLLQAAAAMGVDPAVATTVLEATQVAQPGAPVAATVNAAVTASASAVPPSAAQVLSASQVTIDAAQAMQPTPSQAASQSVTANQVAAQPVNMQPQSAPPNAVAQMPTTAQHITDDVVIQVRQAAQQATQQGPAAQVASNVSAQEFLQQRVGGNKLVNHASASSAQLESEPGVMRLADPLISKLDQLNKPTTISEPTMPAASQLTGASFKTLAQFGQTATFAGTGTVAPSAEVPVTEGGSRLQNLLQGDSAAQQAARNMQNQLGQQLQRMVRDGQWQANINLNPARLGQIRINMTMEDGVLTTQLLSANQGVRELLEGSMPRLRELLEESGLQLGQFDVGSDAGQQQQFAQQQENNGVVTQVASAEDANTAAQGVSQSQHDGDLDTFA